MKVRTRFAPSPTGYLHIGGLRSALYAYLFAKKNHGDFILRIEDTDQVREVEGAKDVIYSTLKETGLLWDEGPDIGGDYGPYIQTERKDIYTKYAKELVEKGGAYYCFCTKEELDERRKAVEAKGETFKYDKHCLHLSKEEVEQKLAANTPYVIRQNIPQTGSTSFDDMVFGTITVDNSTLDDNVLIKADGLPTYNFANVVDDYLMKISHVMRGTEYLSSTPKYNLLYNSFGWEIPKYIHMSPVMRDAQHKLSKRDGDASYDDFIKKGFLKEAIINYIALLGWNPGTNQEIFSLEELVQAFSIEGLSKSPAIFDLEKLIWLNGEYIRALSDEEFLAHAKPWFDKASLEEKHYPILVRILKKRVEYFSQIPQMVEFLKGLNTLTAELFVHKKSKSTIELSIIILNTIVDLLSKIDESDWNEEYLHEFFMKQVEKLQLKNSQVLWPVRIAIAKQAVTPGGAIEITTILGKDETIKRINSAISLLEKNS